MSGERTTTSKSTAAHDLFLTSTSSSRRMWCVLKELTRDCYVYVYLELRTLFTAVCAIEQSLFQAHGAL